MIFNSKLGNVEKMSSDEAIHKMASYIRTMQEELEYRLLNLDSSNVTEINSDATQIKGVYFDGLTSSVSDLKGNFATMAHDMEGLTSIVGDQNGNISTLQQTASDLQSMVSDQGKNISTLTQTASSLTTRVSNAEGSISTLTQTASSLTTKVSNAEGNISTLQQTAEGLQSTVTAQGKNISSLQQTSESLILSVSDLEDGQAASLTLNKNGLIVQGNGGYVEIDGSQLIAGTVIVDTLYGDTVNLKTGRTLVGAIDIAYTTGGYGLEMSTIYGGIRLSAAQNFWVDSAQGSFGITTSGAVFKDCPPVPNAGGALSLGTYAFPWSQVYAETGTINTSDRTEKNSIDYELDRYDALFDGLMPCSFKLNNGTSDRTHIGMISQDVEDLLEHCGLTSKDFAGFIKTPRYEGGYAYGLRYSEFIALCIRQIQLLKARVVALEVSA